MASYSSDIQDRSCFVVGGGENAFKAVKTLMHRGAYITVMAKNLCRQLGNEVSLGRVHHHAGCFNPELLEGQDLVVAATDNPLSNHWVAQHAQRRNIPVTVLAVGNAMS